MVDVACTYHLWMITKRAFGTLAFAVSPFAAVSALPLTSPRPSDSSHYTASRHAHPQLHGMRPCLDGGRHVQPISLLVPPDEHHDD